MSKFSVKRTEKWDGNCKGKYGSRESCLCPHPPPTPTVCIKTLLALGQVLFTCSFNQLPSELPCLVSNKRHVSPLWYMSHPFGTCWDFLQNIQSPGASSSLELLCYRYFLIYLQTVFYINLFSSFLFLPKELSYHWVTFLLLTWRTLFTIFDGSVLLVMNSFIFYLKITLC